MKCMLMIHARLESFLLYWNCGIIWKNHSPPVVFEILPYNLRSYNDQTAVTDMTRPELKGTGVFDTGFSLDSCNICSEKN